MHIQTVIKYVRRSPYQAIAASLIMTLTFLTIAVFAILAIISARVINYYETRPQLSIFFKEEATHEQMDSLRKEIVASGKTTDVKFVSKEDALKIYKEQNKDDPLLLDLVTADILPASLDVQTKDPRYLSELSSVAKKSQYVDEVVFQEEIVDTLVKFTNGLRQIGVIVISVLVLVSVFVILTIIGIKITVRRDEIEIMKLIGASNWFIRVPFLLEGMFYGAIGAVVGFCLSYGVLLVYAQPRIQSFFGNVPVLPIEPLLMFEVFVVLFVSALVLGAFSSFLAVLRYLK